MSEKIGVLVVDDSPIGQSVVCRALSMDPDLEVVGVCADGQEAVRMTRALHPRVITMDVEMPRMDGLAAVAAIMAELPTPILMVTGDPRHQTPEAVYRALELGALALQIKPALEDERECRILAHEVKLLSHIKVIRHMRGRGQPRASEVGTEQGGVRPKLIAIGGSTGGPQVIHRCLAELPADFPIPIALVQHINPSFADSLAAWLNAASKLDVHLAEEGEPLSPGRVLVAPPNHHLCISRPGRARLKTAPARDGHLPSASELLESAGEAFGPAAVGVVLTGMGVDGAAGLASLARAGGRTFAQSRESSVVFGMPGAAVATGTVDRIIHGDELAANLMELVRSSS